MEAVESQAATLSKQVEADIITVQHHVFKLCRNDIKDLTMDWTNE